MALFGGWLQRRWTSLCTKTIGSDDFWYLAVDHLSAYRALEPLIASHASGRVLDLGAGRLSWRSTLAGYASEYVSADVESCHPDLDLILDLQEPFPVPDASFDTLFCASVLEHVPQPWQVLSEFRRVLAPGGKVILSVPFVYYLHGAPQDYYRFTEFGVRHLAEEANLEVVVVQHSGGLFHSQIQVVSMLLAALLWRGPLRVFVKLGTRLLLAMARIFDSPDRQGRFAQLVNVVLRRPE